MKKFNSHIYKNHISNIQKQKVLSTVLQKEQPTSNIARKFGLKKFSTYSVILIRHKSMCEMLQEYCNMVKILLRLIDFKICTVSAG